MSRGADPWARGNGDSRDQPKKVPRQKYSASSSWAHWHPLSASDSSTTPDPPTIARSWPTPAKPLAVSGHARPRPTEFCTGESLCDIDCAIDFNALAHKFTKHSAAVHLLKGIDGSSHAVQLAHWSLFPSVGTWAAQRCFPIAAVGCGVRMDVGFHCSRIRRAAFDIAMECVRIFDELSDGEYDPHTQSMMLSETFYVVLREWPHGLFLAPASCTEQAQAPVEDRLGLWAE